MVMSSNRRPPLREIKSLYDCTILYAGVFTTSHASQPADTVCGALYGNTHFDGCVLMPIAGARAYEPRKIVSYAGGTGIFYMNNPFTGATGLVPYVIIQDTVDPVVGVNSVANVAMFHVIGNKADTAITVPDDISSIVRYLKGILGGVKISAYAQGTQACVVTTEHFLSSPIVAGTFTLHLDTVNMVANDVLEVRVYQMVLTGGTARVAYFMTYYGVQLTDDLIKVSTPISNELVEANALRFSIKQTFGAAGRNVPWKVLRSG